MASACLAGVVCRYDGTARTVDEIAALFRRGEVILFCPEVLGGLPTPRPRMELRGGDGTAALAGTALVVSQNGTDETPAMLDGARISAAIADAVKPEKIFLKSKSPSCNCAAEFPVGVTASLLNQKGYLLESAG